MDLYPDQARVFTLQFGIFMETIAEWNKQKNSYVPVAFTFTYYDQRKIFSIVYGPTIQKKTSFTIHIILDLLYFSIS